jgi:hypothetical protein
MAVAYMLPDGRIILGAGPVFSYYEFKHPMGDRLTDEKWTEMLEKGENPPQPEWVSSFVHPVTFSPETNDDTDRDKLPDSWERSIWGSIDVVNDRNGDPDQDGLTNEQECAAGTNPDDSNSRLRWLDIAPSESGTLLRWSSVGGKRYRISYSDNLKRWYLLGSPVTAETETADVSDAGAASSKHRFYRVKIIP